MTDLNDPLDDIFGALRTEPAPAVPARIAPAVEAAAAIHIEPCRKCRGTGRFITYTGRPGGACFACGGAGRKTFKTDAATLPAHREAAAERRERQAADAWTSFTEKHPEAAAWLESKANLGNAFATSLRDAVKKYGDLTERQLAAVSRSVAQDAEKKAAAKAREESAPTVTVEKMEAAFRSAQANGIARPKLRLDTFIFKLAPDHGRNAGSIYVTEGEAYLGRITAGRLILTRDGAPREAAILAAIADPDASARAYGHRTGACSCCGRTLTNKLSIDLGIGPICRGKFGWSGAEAIDEEAGE